MRSPNFLDALASRGVDIAILLILTLFVYWMARSLIASHAPAALSGIPREIRQLISAKEFAHAADKLAFMGHYDEAIDTLLQGNLLARAADLALRKGKAEQAASLFEQAGDWKKAVEIYVEKKNFDQAETLCEKQGHCEDLGDLYIQKGELALSARCFLRIKQYGSAGAALLKLGKKEEAAYAFLKAFAITKKEMLGDGITPVNPELERLGMEAGKLFELIQQWEQAARVYMEINRSEEALRCYSRLKDFKRAAQLAQSVGNLEQAGHFLELLGDFKSAATMAGEKLLQVGDLAGAAAKFREAQDFERAAEVYVDLQNYERAAEMYAKAAEFQLAGNYFRQAGLSEKAGEAFEHAKQWEDAIVCYQQANLLDKEMGVRQKIGDYVGIAQNLYRQGFKDKAMATLGQVRETHPRYRFALALKGRMALDDGDLPKAKELFGQSIGAVEQVTHEDLDTIYNLARVGDQLQIPTNAANILEKMLLENLVDPSAIEKAKKLQKTLAQRAFGMAAPSFISTGESPLLHPSGVHMTKRRYIPLREIGRGGMGIVYTAKDTNLDRIIALKILPPSLKKNERAVSTFLREAKAAAALNHPNIVTVHDSGLQDGEYYIAMEYVEGKTLKDIVKKRGRLSVASVVEVGKQLLSGLAYAHSQNIVHRDLTSSNIMWTKQKIVKIMDFGLAKVIKELSNEQSIVGGTPSYMSPEQAVGNPIDHRTDIYSLGIILYEMCVGEVPFREGDLAYHHLHTPPPSPRDRIPDLPDLLVKMILQCLEKKRSNRFQKISEMQEVMEPLL